MRTRQEIINQLKLDNPSLVETINGEVMPLSAESYEETINKWADFEEEMEIKQAEELVLAGRAEFRAQLRLQWESLPSWIKGPYRPLFDAANSLLDQGDDDSAKDMIYYAEPQLRYTEEQAAIFEQVKSSFVLAIQAVPKL